MAPATVPDEIVLEPRHGGPRPREIRRRALGDPRPRPADPCGAGDDIDRRPKRLHARCVQAVASRYDRITVSRAYESQLCDDPEGPDASRT